MIKINQSEQSLDIPRPMRGENSDHLVFLCCSVRLSGGRVGHLEPLQLHLWPRDPGEEAGGAEAGEQRRSFLPGPAAEQAVRGGVPAGGRHGQAEPSGSQALRGETSNSTSSQR